MKRSKLIGILMLVCAIAHGQTFTDLAVPQYDGKTKIRKAHTVIDANFAKVEGGPTLSATDSAADSWSIKSTQPSTTGLMSTVTLLDSSIPQADGDKVYVDLFEGVNDSAESTVWGSIQVVVDDNTTNTEDSAIEVKVMVAGTATKVVDVDAVGVDVDGDVSGTTIGGITEANLTDKSATEAVSGARTFSGGITKSGLDIDTPTALNVTNDQVITVSAGSYVLTGIGSADGASNAFTIANATAGTKVRFVMAHASTNLCAITEGTGRYLTATTIAIGPDDVLKMYAPSASVWVSDGHQNN